MIKQWCNRRLCFAAGGTGCKDCYIAVVAAESTGAAVGGLAAAESIGVAAHSIAAAVRSLDSCCCIGCRSIVHFGFDLDLSPTFATPHYY